MPLNPADVGSGSPPPLRYQLNTGGLIAIRHSHNLSFTSKGRLPSPHGTYGTFVPSLEGLSLLLKR